MFSARDKEQMIVRGSNPDEVLRQIEYFRTGFPFLPVIEAAGPGKGILQVSDTEVEKLKLLFDEKAGSGLKIMKFVPASGAASRMFKSLFAALEELNSGKGEEEVLAGNKDAREFYERIDDFAFAGELKDIIRKEGKNRGFRNFLEYLLNAGGMNYGSMPKGLLLFHKYGDACRTPFEEHLVEGVSYAKDNKDVVRLHFTVSPEHETAFASLLERVKEKYEAQFGVSFEVGFSQQKPSTDTIAVDLNNLPFREEDGSLLFRPGGHGALLENLNDLDADLVFIKNIDNVVPDKLKQPTFTYKKVLAGLLLKYQDQIFLYQKELNEKFPHSIESGFLAEASGFLENILNTKPAENHYYTEKEDLVRYLREKFNRPLRVCGMVKNQGEPGGGPFLTRNHDGTVSLQIAESVQIDHDDPVRADIARHATHFNPVDLVCGLKNYKGKKYDLMQFRDPATGFISRKSKDGKDLKAQELPGLWNGAMSDWNTVFVEVPVETFNPVKTVNDLLRDQHQ
ncbi:MAG TPA: DUF4301 family protein [Prolixibacteraceae bacterium]|nr:DUF4301 family protein [Prolixibacteraceae bacterium]HOS01271.1 DUF4301 family protein [Prolixibacteraceae bacterium]HOS91291.1 DUF4301 family protein [Prolixibacteraceae bacterium]HPL46332.1 DUF4301 family protein [Prolixibacteraceae bacterium]HQE53107.1 DUF4301 family protein [Prolixibacteraceae bacterium]